ncbi:MAG: phosphoglycerate kinase [Candidatus Sungiibacteriota bacterium]
MRLLKDALIIKGTPLILRADCDIAIAGGRIQDDFRINAFLPTLRLLAQRGARIRIIAHRGRPGGKTNSQMSLAPIGLFLADTLGRRVQFIEDPFSERVFQKYRESKDILLFENLRFWQGEEKNDPAFARAIARWGEIYINEAFANCHRAHCSMVALPRLMPAYAGLHLSAEITALECVMKNPARPFIAVFGGVKIETKLPLMRRFLRDADRVLVGGALANTLFAAAGKNIGRSLAENDVKNVGILLKHKKLALPMDVLAADALHSAAARHIRSADSVGADEYIVDIGPASRKIFGAIIGDAKTIVWNGPMGYAEVSAYAKGTKAIADAMRKNKGFTVVGGGDTAAFLSRHHLTSGFRHISTGGGAMLAFLAGKKLPGIEALSI